MSKSSKRKNVTTEKYYTKPIIARQLICDIKSVIDYSKIVRVIEPSAGCGNFSKLIDNCVSYDIEPDDDSIIKADFLTLKIEYEHNTLVLGNPPFGRQSSLALKFIKKSAQIADYIAFILPISFQKDSMKNKVPLTHSLLFEKVLEPSIFIRPNGEESFLRTVFQIWHRFKRIKKVSRTIDGFTFVKTFETANFAFRRVGAKAGLIIDDMSSVSTASHYFIKCDEKYKLLLSKIDWSDVSVKTIGPRSISRAEIIEKLLNIL